MKPLRTPKQKIIMDLIFKAVSAGEFLNISDLHARLPYKCAYGSFRMSLKYLEKHKLIEKEKTGNSTLIKPTSNGYAWFQSG